MHAMNNKNLQAISTFPQFDEVNRYLTEAAYCKNNCVRQELLLIDRAYRENDVKALRLLHQLYFGVVIESAHHFRNTGIPLHILIREGNLGLSKALESYVPSDKTRLASHCSDLTRKQILEFVLTSWNSARIAKVETRKINIGWLTESEIVAIAKRLGIDAVAIEQIKENIHAYNEAVASNSKLAVGCDIVF